jgi:hypothetical protein
MSVAKGKGTGEKVPFDTARALFEILVRTKSVEDKDDEKKRRFTSRC